MDANVPRRDGVPNKIGRVIVLHGQAMERVTKLYQEAASLRALAQRPDMLPLRDQLLDLAVRYEKLARRMEENPQAADLRPEAFPPDLH